MNIKSIRPYLVIVSLIIGFFIYASINGLVYRESKVDRNTDDNGSHRRMGIGRFYHK